MVSNIYAARALSRLPRKLVFYDFNDSPFQFAAAPAWARGYWQRTLAQVDAIFVVSEYYRRELSAQTDRPLVLLGNGVEYAHFAAPREAPAALAALPRPRIGYLGLLSHFLDFELLEALRRARRGGTLVLDRPRRPGHRRGRAGAGRARGRVRAGPAAVRGRAGVAAGARRRRDPVPRRAAARAGHQPQQGLPVPGRRAAGRDHAGPRPGAGAAAAAVRHRRPGAGSGRSRARWTRRATRRRPRALARPHDWDALAARMVGEIERRVARPAGGRTAAS